MRVGRAALLGLLAAAMVTTTGVPEAAACSGAECGIPACDVWETVKVRPEMARTRTISCRYAVGATLETPPEHGEVTDVSADWQGLRFTMRADADAPREDSAVFDVEGHEGSVDVKVTFRVLPESENSAPVCEGDAVEQRSSGEGPVELYMHPWCYDPDDDEFVMDGGGPGEHRRAPLSVAAGRSESNWPYTTKTSSGRETGTVWATDVLGARSAEAELRAHVGPGVDRRANCHPNPWYIWGWESAPVHTRPGAIRRFAVICADEDGDPFVPTLGTLPQRGVLTMLTVDPPSQGWSGYEQWVEASYVPPARVSSATSSRSFRAASSAATGPARW